MRGQILQGTINTAFLFERTSRHQQQKKQEVDSSKDRNFRDAPQCKTTVYKSLANLLNSMQ